jgi:hypothetical protein
MLYQRKKSVKRSNPRSSTGKTTLEKLLKMQKKHISAMLPLYVQNYPYTHWKV